MSEPKPARKPAAKRPAAKRTRKPAIKKQDAVVIVEEVPPPVYGIEITHLGRPPTTNRERQSGYRWRGGKQTKDWRAAATLRWRSAMATWAAPDTAHVTPIDGPVVVEVTPLHKDRRSPQDTGACAPAAKAAIDGAVDAGLILDDHQAIIRRITFHAPEITGSDGLRVTLTPKGPSS
jgi:hypothetical protein